MAKSFYTLATGRKHALQELFEVLPQVIADNHNYKLSQKEAKSTSNYLREPFPQNNLCLCNGYLV